MLEEASRELAEKHAEHTETRDQLNVESMIVVTDGRTKSKS